MAVLEDLYWFYKMVAAGGPDGTEADQAVVEDAERAARWCEANVPQLKIEDLPLPPPRTSPTAREIAVRFLSFTPSSREYIGRQFEVDLPGPGIMSRRDRDQEILRQIGKAGRAHELWEKMS